MHLYPIMEVHRVPDFEVTGNGTHPHWTRVEWTALARVGAGTSAYATRAKLLYSPTGIYFLTDAEDRRLSCTFTEHFSDLFREDVIEVFLWPDERYPVYFEYEISPLGCELPIMVSNNAGKFCGWLPWHFTNSRKTRFATHVRGGEKRSQAGVTGWMTEVFIPFDLLVGLGKSHPKPGDHWRANLYRIDYDESPPSQWAWSTATGGDFHDFPRFGTIVFGPAVE